MPLLRLIGSPGSPTWRRSVQSRTQTVMPGEIVGGSFASPAGERSTAIRTRCPKRCVLVAQADQLARHLLDVA